MSVLLPEGFVATAQFGRDRLHLKALVAGGDPFPGAVGLHGGERRAPPLCLGLSYVGGGGESDLAGADNLADGQRCDIAADLSVGVDHHQPGREPGVDPPFA